MSLHRRRSGRRRDVPSAVGGERGQRREPAVERILRERPAGVPLPRKAILIVEAPLRLELTAPGGPSLAVISDRTLRVHRLLREFHERELARAVYAAILWESIAARESAADAPWVVEGVSAALADRWLATAHPRHRTVYDWIGYLNYAARLGLGQYDLSKINVTGGPAPAAVKISYRLHDQISAEMEWQQPFPSCVGGGGRLPRVPGQTR